MPTATATVTVTQVPAADVAAPKKSRKKLFLVIGLVVLLLGAGGYVAKGLLGGDAAAEPDPKTVAGKVETLSPITLNLADGRYLKLTLALQLSEAAGLGAGTAGEGAAVAPTVDGAKALDAAIDVLGRRTYAQLLATGGRASAQKALSAEVRKRYDGDVLRVYFSEFLMQ
jgi:flagellar protein FliL